MQTTFCGKERAQMIRGRLKMTQYIAGVLVGVALLAAGSTAEALHWELVGGVWVGYDTPFFDAYYDPFDDTLTVEVYASGGPLVVEATALASFFWGPYCDVYIWADGASITNMKFKGHDTCWLYVAGFVEFANKFMMKKGVVGELDDYVDDFGLYRDSIFGPKKILMKWGHASGAVLGPEWLRSLTREEGQKPSVEGVSKREGAVEEKIARLEAMKAAVDESGEDDDPDDDEEFEAEDSSADVDLSPGDKVAIFQSLLLNAK
jgi:hypothetical protein